METEDGKDAGSTHGRTGPVAEGDFPDRAGIHGCFDPKGLGSVSLKQKAGPDDSVPAGGSGGGQV